MTMQAEVGMHFEPLATEERSFHDASYDEIMAPHRELQAGLHQLRLELAEERALEEAKDRINQAAVDAMLEDEIVAAYVSELGKNKYGESFDEMTTERKLAALRVLPHVENFQTYKEGYERVIMPLRAFREEQRAQRGVKTGQPATEVAPSQPTPEPEVDEVTKEVYQNLIKILEKVVDDHDKVIANYHAVLSTHPIQPEKSASQPTAATSHDWNKTGTVNSSTRTKWDGLPPLRTPDGKLIKLQPYQPETPSEYMLDAIAYIGNSAFRLAEAGVDKLKDVQMPDGKKLAVAASLIGIIGMQASTTSENTVENRGTQTASQQEMALTSVSEITNFLDDVKPAEPSVVDVDSKPIADFLETVASMQAEELSANETPEIKQAIAQHVKLLEVVVTNPEVAKAALNANIAQAKSAFSQEFVSAYAAELSKDGTLTTEQMDVAMRLLARMHEIGSTPAEQIEIAKELSVADDVVTETPQVNEPQAPAEVVPLPTESHAPVQKPATPEVKTPELTLNIEAYEGAAWTKDQLRLVQENLPVYLEAAKQADLPWALLAVIHMREHRLVASNPSNGQGIYQFVDKRGGPYPEGPVSREEFVRQTGLVATFLKEKAKSSNNDLQKNLTAQSDAETIKDTLFSYNGRSKQYREQAHRLGFKFGRDGSPYVMNLADDQRDPNKNPDGWGQVKKDFGPVEFPANQDAGAFVLYRDLMSVAGTPVGDASGERLSTEEIEQLKMPNGKHIVEELKKKYEGVSGRLTADETERLGDAWGEFRLHPAAAKGFLKMNEAYKAEFGEDIFLKDAYRSYDEQVKVKEKLPEFAATPGRSQHGWGMGIDANDGVQKEGSKKHEWFEKHAHKYGFVNPEWAHNDDGKQEEAWHWEFWGSEATFEETNSFNG